MYVVGDFPGGRVTKILPSQCRGIQVQSLVEELDPQHAPTKSLNTATKKQTCENSMRASQVVLVVENTPANAGDARGVGLIPGSGRPPGGGHSNPFQYSCLENSMGRGAWRATVHWVAKSQTQLKRLSTETDRST